MNWDQIEGKWNQLTGSARERWGKLTDDDWQAIMGKKDQLVGRIQERYGVAKEEAEKQADEWSHALNTVLKKKEVAPVSPEVPPPAGGDPEPEEIARLAHQYWHQRGRPTGTPEEDWFRAEQEIKLRQQGRA